MINKKFSWLSICIYYDMNNWNFLLSKGVKPFIEQMLDAKICDDFMFFRGWIRGEHLELVFKGEKNKLNEILIPKFNSYFNQFLKDNPCEIKKRILPIPYWFIDYPFNSFVYTNFKFHKLEVIKLSGGVKASKLAFKQFSLSSKVALSIIPNINELDTQVTTTVCLQLILGFLRNVEMSLGEAMHFTEDLFQNCLPNTTHIPKEFEKEKTILLENIQILQDGLNQNFISQEDELVEYIEMLWEAFNENGEFDEDWINEWINFVRANYSKLKLLQSGGCIVIPDHFKFNPNVDIPEERQELWLIYQFYIRTLSLQMGLYNANELNLYFTLKEAIRILSKKEETAYLK